MKTFKNAEKNQMQQDHLSNKEARQNCSKPNESRPSDLVQGEASNEYLSLRRVQGLASHYSATKTINKTQ